VDPDRQEGRHGARRGGQEEEDVDVRQPVPGDVEPGREQGRDLTSQDRGDGEADPARRRDGREIEGP